MVNMEILDKVVQIVYLIISALAAVVVILGVVQAMGRFTLLKLSSGNIDSSISENEAIRQHLGAHLLLGLEIFIAADIISSVVSPSWQKVGMLAAIVGIRTILSYFLRKELRQG